MLSIPTLEQYLTTPNYKGLRNWTIKISYYDQDKANDLIADCLVIPWAKLVREYDKNLCPDFYKYVFLQFRYNVYRMYEAKKRKAKIGTDIDAITVTATDYNSASEVEGAFQGLADTLSKEGEAELNLARKELQEALAKLEPSLSFILYNHALGFSFEDIGKKLGFSRVTVGTMYNGALAQLKRITKAEG